MRIENVEAVLATASGRAYVFCKILTDNGIAGWGEAFARADREEAIAAHIRAMARYAVGRSPFDIKQFCQIMHLDYAGKRAGYDYYAALSAIEQAHWDVVGKALGQPVHNLLGGACRGRIRVYANGWANGDDPHDVAASRARDVVSRGFTALKWDPFPNPWRTFIDRRDEQAAIASVRAVREAVGPDVDLLIEVHRRLAMAHAIRVARAIADCRPYWYEEPVHTQNVSALAEVRRQIDIPVVAGEDYYGKGDFRLLFEARGADIVNPDVSTTGGILEMKEIAAMAEPYDVAVAPHGASTLIGFAATLQVSAAMTNFIITDYYLPSEEFAHEILAEPFRPVDGYVAVRTSPGLGVQVNEDALRRHPYASLPKRAFRTPDEEDL